MRPERAGLFPVHRSCRTPTHLLLAALAFISCQSGAPGRLTVEDAGRFDFELETDSSPSRTTDGLSGIAYLGGDDYLVVSDASSYLHRLTIAIDRSTGAVTSVRASGGLQLRGADGTPLSGDQLKDREDLALEFSGRRLLIANERCAPAPLFPCIEVHDMETGRRLQRAGPGDDPQMEVFRRVEVNFGFEAVAVMPENRGYWVATERALNIDGGQAGVDAGSPVRLQRLSPDFVGTGQFVYVTDSISSPIRDSEPLARFSGSRIVSMFALPGGALVTLENVLQGDGSGAAETRIRLYEVTLSDATDVSAPEFATGLRGKLYRPVGKRLLIELAFAGTDSNYEGMALGRQLENGDYSLLLIRDNGVGADQTIHALRLRVDG